jgi:hypothetical protein
MDAEHAEDCGEVYLHGVLRQAQCLSDITVGLALGQKL